MSKSVVSKRKPNSSKREAKVVARRQSLIDAAINVIAEHGLTGVTVSTIAKEAGCSYGVVSFHFQTKDGIIFAALDYLAEEYQSTISRNLEKEASPAQRIRKMIDSDFNAKASNAKKVAVWVAFWAEAVRVGEYKERCAEIKSYYNAVSEKDISDLATERETEVDAFRLARSLNAMIDGYWVANLISSGKGAEARDEARAACMAFMRGYFPDDF